MNRAPVIAAAAVVAAVGGFGAAALTRGSTAAATGQLSEANVATTRFDPPVVGTTSVPALRVVVRHHARPKKERPVPTTIVHVDPTPPPGSYTPPASTAPRNNTPNPTTPHKTKPKGGGDTIDRSRAG